MATTKLSDKQKAVRDAKRQATRGGGTKITAHELLVLAACFAVSNMGMPRPDRATVEKMLADAGNQRNPLTLNSAVLWVAEQYMETNEHQRMFEREARGWRDEYLLGYTREMVAATWPDMAQLLWASNNETENDVS